MSLTHPAFDNFPLSFEQVLQRFPGQAASRQLPMRVRDGDTYEALGELARHEIDYKAYRLLGIDTPELHSASSEERATAQKAAAFLTAMIVARPMIGITFRDRMTFDRYLVVPLLVDEGGEVFTDIRDVLLANGLAHQWAPTKWVEHFGREPGDTERVGDGFAKSRVK